MSIKYVATARGGYAKANGGIIGYTRSLAEAEMFATPTALMFWLGGHWVGFKALQLEVKIVKRKIVKFPDPKDLWDL